MKTIHGSVSTNESSTALSNKVGRITLGACVGLGLDLVVVLIVIAIYLARRWRSRVHKPSHPNQGSSHIAFRLSSLHTPETAQLGGIQTALNVELPALKDEVPELPGANPQFTDPLELKDSENNRREV